MPIPAPGRPNIQSVLQIRKDECRTCVMIAIGEEKCAAQTYIGDDRGESGLTIALAMISPCRWNVKKSSYRFTMPQLLLLQQKSIEPPHTTKADHLFTLQYILQRNHFLLT